MGPVWGCYWIAWSRLRQQCALDSRLGSRLGRAGSSPAARTGQNRAGPVCPWPDGLVLGRSGSSPAARTGQDRAGPDCPWPDGLVLGRSGSSPAAGPARTGQDRARLGQLCSRALGLVPGRPTGQDRRGPCQAGTALSSGARARSGSSPAARTGLPPGPAGDVPVRSGPSPAARHAVRAGARPRSLEAL